MQYTCACNGGYENWRVHHGCDDINECCNKVRGVVRRRYECYLPAQGNARCTHNCVKTADNNGICKNTAGSFTCNTCSVSGEESVLVSRA